MTTKVTIECPDNSHWHVKVETLDQEFDKEKGVMTDNWNRVESQTVVLKQGEKHETYLTSSRRLLLTEIEPEASNG